MSFDILGDTFKALENKYESELPLQTPVIMRLDGKAFHTFTRKFEKPFSDIIRNAMVKATEVLCKEMQNARFGYTQSDEISILLYEPAERSQAWYNNRVQKMVSVAASICSIEFNKQIAEQRPLNHDNLGDAYFDARVISISPDEVANYFKWRQEDAVRNSISMLAQAHFSHKKLHKKNRRDMLSMLQSKEIRWMSLDDWKKNGSTIIKMWREKQGPNGEVVHRSYWAAMEKSPNFDSCTIKCPSGFESDFISKYLEQEVTNVLS